MLDRIRPFPEIVTEMLDQLPKEVFRSKTTTFLDPCMGGGQFVSGIEKRLREYGHSDANIAERVYGVEENHFPHDFAVNTYNLVGNYYVEKNYLEYDEKMKFDVQMLNPPYNFGPAQHQYIKFVDRALESSTLKISVIIPVAWTYSPRFADFRKRVADSGLRTIRFLKREEFPGIHQDVCIVSIDKEYRGDTIKVISKSGYSHDVPRTGEEIRAFDSDIEVSIYKKFAKNSGFELFRGVNKTVKHHGEKEFTDSIQTKRTKKTPHKMLSRLLGNQSKNEYFWVASVTDAHSTKFKVVTSKLTSQVGKVDYWQVVPPNTPVSEALVYIIADSQSAANQIKKYLETNLVVKYAFKKTMLTTRMSKSLMYRIPTPEDLKRLRLTKKELNYIEETVK